MNQVNGLDLLQRGIEIYDALKDDMHQALGLKLYAENLMQITESLRAVHNFLDEKERNIEETLERAHRLSREGLRKAVVVVSIIKEQCKTLALVLSDSVPGEKHEKLADVCLYFSEFAKDTAANVKEAIETLQKASDELEDAKSKFSLVVKAMQRVHTELLSEQKAAEARVRAAACGSVGVGALFGPIGQLIAQNLATGITEGYTIPRLEEFCDSQRKNVEEYIVGFNKMHEETKGMADKIETRCEDLIKIHAKLATAKTDSVVAIKSTSERTFVVVSKKIADLVKACEEFLQGCK